MATVSSPPPSSNPHSDIDLESRLDAEIQRVRAEVSRIRTQSQHLSVALLGSSRVQKHIASRKVSGSITVAIQERLNEAVEKQQTQNEISLQRSAVGVTSFPFTDPAPERRGEPSMLGVRFDLSSPSFNRTTADPSLWSDESSEDVDQITNNNHNKHVYYVILRRLQHRGLTYMHLHQNNVPKHIDVLGYSYKHLPLPDELRDIADMNNPREESETFHDDSGIDVTQDIDPDTTDDTTSIDPTARQPPTSRPYGVNVQGTSQNLHQFIASIRDDLHAWHNRTQTIRYLRHVLDLTSSSIDADRDAEPEPVTQSKYNVFDLVQSTNDATQVQITWLDGTLALLKVAYDGTVARAVAYGSRPAQQTMLALGDEGSAVDESALQQENVGEMSHVRLWDVERILSRDEGAGDGKVRLLDLDQRLKLLAERSGSAHV